MQFHKTLSRPATESISDLSAIARLSPVGVLEQLASQPEGLDQKEVEKRLQIYGQNDAASETRWVRTWCYLERLRNDMLLPSLAVALFLFFIGKTIAGGIIVLVLLASVVLTVVHIYLSKRDRKKLRGKIGMTARVLRIYRMENRATEIDTGSKFRKIPLRMLVPGDVVALAAGDRVPADVRLIQSDNIVLNQSLLSGSLLPVEKSAEPYTGEAANPFDMANICLMGSTVVSGSGVGVVILTGTRTWLGLKTP